MMLLTIPLLLHNTNYSVTNYSVKMMLLLCMYVLMYVYMYVCMYCVQHVLYVCMYVQYCYSIYKMYMV